MVDTALAGGIAAFTTAITLVTIRVPVTLSIIMMTCTSRALTSCRQQRRCRQDDSEQSPKVVFSVADPDPNPDPPDPHVFWPPGT
jgi:hypothetical protein